MMMILTKSNIFAQVEEPAHNARLEAILSILAPFSETFRLHKSLCKIAY